MWRLPINETLRPNEYIIETDVINQDAQDDYGRIDKEKLKYPVDIRATVRFDYHLRYLPVKENGNYTWIEVAKKFEIFMEPLSRKESDLIAIHDVYRAKVLPFSPALENLMKKEPIT